MVKNAEKGRMDQGRTLIACTSKAQTCFQARNISINHAVVDLLDLFYLCAFHCTMFPFEL